jgi:hypothetical protein
MLTEFYSLSSNKTGMCSRTARQDSERLSIQGKIENVFICIRRTAPKNFEAANTDNEFSCTFFANHQSGEHHISFSLRESDSWHTNSLPQLNERKKNSLSHG